jgi:energy-coupling factor transporter ATP-binding protein EcfA2
VARAVARRATYRYEVWLRVRRRSVVRPRGRAYRSWLRELRPEQLCQPVEAVRMALAEHLVAMRPAVAHWGEFGRDEAGMLVTDTWAVLLRTGSEADVRERNEAWARVRNSEVLGRLDDLGRAFVSPFATDTLMRRSFARTGVRQAVFQLGERTANAVAELMARDVPEIHPGELRMLIGDLGSGKSEVAECWHRAAVERLASIPSSNLAIWLNAIDVHGSLESEIARWVDSGMRGRGIDLVIDGLDEVSPRRGAAIVSSATVFIAGATTSRILLTSREPFGASPDIRIRATALTSAQVDSVLSVVTGRPIGSYVFPEALRSTVTVPFFLLAAATLMARGMKPATAPEILRDVVELALTQPKERVTLNRVEANAALEQLALACMSKGTPVAGSELTAGGRALVLQTSLVRSESGRLSFTLPIFQQWFAANSILGGHVDIEGVARDTDNFGTWRWPLALAVVMGREVEVDQILLALTRHNPAGVFWIITRGAPGRPARHQPAMPNATDRLATAYVAFEEGLLDLAKMVLPRNEDGDLATLGVLLDTGRSVLTTSWKRSSDPARTVPLPPGIGTEMMASRAADWMGLRWGGIGGQPVAIWAWAIEEINGAFGGLAEGRHLGTKSKVWQQEYHYAMCRTIVGRFGQLDHRPIDTEEVLAVLDRVFAGEPDAVILGNGLRLESSELNDLRDSLAKRATIERPWLAPDLVGNPRGRMISDLYSERALRHLVHDVYSGAIEIYRELAGDDFACFRDSLGPLVDPRIGLLCELGFPEVAAAPMPEPFLHYLVLPLTTIEDLTSEGRWTGVSGAPVRVALGEAAAMPKFEDAVAAVRSWSAQQNASPQEGFTMSHGIVDVYGDRPASRQALVWLKSDLQRFGAGGNLRVPDRW